MKKTKIALGLSLVSAIALTSGVQAAHKGKHHIELKNLEKRVHDLEIGHSGKRHIHSPSGAKVALSGHVTRALQWADSTPNAGLSNIDNDFKPTNINVDAQHTMGCHKVTGVVNVAYVDNSSVDTSVISNETGAKLEVYHAHAKYTNGTHGVVTVGKADTASYGITTIDFSGTGAVSKGPCAHDIGKGITLRTNAAAAGLDVSAVTVARVWSPFTGTGRRRNLVRYDSPEYYGFRASVSHGDRSSTDAALRFGGEFGGFKVGAGASYFKKGGSANRLVGTTAVRGTHFSGVAGSLAVLHKDTGLNVMASSGYRSHSGNVGLKDAYMWFVKGGWRGHVPGLNKWGETAIAGNYGMSDHVRIVTAPAAGGAFGAQNNRNSTQIWGFSVTQNVEKLGTDLFVSGQWVDHDVSTGIGVDPTTVFFGVVGAKVKI